MTFAEMKTETFRRLEEARSTPVYFSEADVEEAINAGYMELSDATEWHERFRTIDLLALRPYYDLRTVIGANVLTPGAAFNETTSQWLLPLRPVDLDSRDRRWEIVTGEPQALMMRGLWWLGYWPQCSSDSGTVKQYYTALPDPLEDDEDEPGFPETFHQGCVEFALADLWAQDAETGKALEAWERYLGIERGLEASIQGRAAVPLRQGYGARA